MIKYDNSHSEDIFNFVEGYKQNALQDHLAEFINCQFQAARSHRDSCGVTKRLEDSWRQYRSKYNPEDAELVQDTNIYMPISQVKARAAISWIQDILTNHQDKPWTLSPTPLPDLPDNAKEAVVDTLLAEFERFGIPAPEQINLRINEYKNVAQSHIENAAKEAVTRMEKQIFDQMLQGNWRETFEDATHDIAWSLNTFIKGPFVKEQKRLGWHGDSVKAYTVPCLCVERVNPFNVYPMPDTTNPQNGSGVIEIVSMTQSDLYNSKDIYGFFAPAINKTISSHPNGYSICFDNGDKDSDASNFGKLVGSSTSTNEKADSLGNYQVIVYYGKIPGRMLYDYGIDEINGKAVEVLDTYESEIWVIDGVTVRAILNPHPLGHRPICSTSFSKVPGSFWGTGLMEVLAPTQRICNAAARNLCTNMSLASGVVGEVDVDRLSEDEEDINYIDPRRIYKVSSQTVGQNRDAFRFYNINSHANELMTVYQNFAKEADDVSGIPAYVLGNPHVAGAGRTLGGLSLLMGNAAKGVKKVISNIDKDCIEGIVKAYYEFNMLYGTDDTLKVDAEVLARGSSGLLQRELSQSRTVEVMNSVLPFLSYPGLINPAGVANLLKTMIDGLGHDGSLIVNDPNRPAELQAAAAGGFSSLATENQPSTSPGTPPPALDGRSIPQGAGAGNPNFPTPINLPQGG